MRAFGADGPALEHPVITTVILRHPPKADVVAWTGTGTIARRARLVVFDRATRTTHEADVELAPVEAGAAADEDAPATFLGSHAVAGVFPAVSFDRFEEGSKVALADERVIAALHRRGIEDLSKVRLYAPPAGDYPPGREGHNIGWGTAYVQDDPRDTLFARPVEGLRVELDFDSLEILDVVDGPIVPLSEETGRYGDEESVGGWRTDVAPLEITQPTVRASSRRAQMRGRSGASASACTPTTASC